LPSSARKTLSAALMRAAKLPECTPTPAFTPTPEFTPTSGEALASDDSSEGECGEELIELPLVSPPLGAGRPFRMASSASAGLAPSWAAAAVVAGAHVSAPRGLVAAAAAAAGCGVRSAAIKAGGEAAAFGDQRPMPEEVVVADSDMALGDARVGTSNLNGAAAAPLTGGVADCGGGARGTPINCGGTPGMSHGSGAGSAAEATGGGTGGGGSRRTDAPRVPSVRFSWRAR
jgi:hypothetical protein